MKKLSESWVMKAIIPYLILALIVISAAFGIVSFMRLREVVVQVDRSITDTGELLSSNPLIVEALEKGYTDNELKEYLDELIKANEYVDYVVLVNNDDIRIYHPEHELIGGTFTGGDEAAILTGSAPYISEHMGRNENQRRYFEAVYDHEDRQIGFLMVSCFTRAIQAMRTEAITDLTVIFAVSLLLILLAGILVSMRVRRILLGYEPYQMAEMFRRREEVLGTIKEGLILVNGSWDVQYYSPSAAGLIKSDGQNDEAIRNFLDRLIRPMIMDHSDRIHNQEISYKDSVILVNILPIHEDERYTGSLILLNDRTETMRMAEELTGVKHIVEALRAATHEQKNKLHVILGLLQIGETEQAEEYITDITGERETDSRILSAVEDRTAAALLLGKKSRAKELGIHFDLMKGSHLSADNGYLKTEELITVIGNLLENAFDALEEQTGERSVSLYVSDENDALMIVCDDNGGGMSEEVRQKILSEKYTTKGEGHGTGLVLIRQILDKCHGSLEIETEEGEGSSFTVTVTKKISERSVV
ncbi:MAG: sensor histidine kinase [Solobacterium sp.]|nr:sensor histidine kinase [Solobacterium sp.]